VQDIRSYIQTYNIPLDITTLDFVNEYISPIFPQLMQKSRYHQVASGSIKQLWMKFLSTITVFEMFYTTEVENLFNALDKHAGTEQQAEFLHRLNSDDEQQVKMTYILITSVAGMWQLKKKLKVVKRRMSRNKLTKYDPLEYLKTTCCEDVDPISLLPPDPEEWYVAFKHDSGKYEHCMSFTDLITMSRKVENHILQNGSFKCPKCRQFINWRQIFDEIRQFEHKILFKAGLRYSQEIKRQNRLEALVPDDEKLLFFFKCKDLLRQKKKKTPRATQKQKQKQQRSPIRTQKQKQKQQRSPPLRTANQKSFKRKRQQTNSPSSSRKRHR
jgi:hypothetical protein